MQLVRLWDAFPYATTQAIVHSNQQKENTVLCYKYHG